MSLPPRSSQSKADKAIKNLKTCNTKWEISAMKSAENTNRPKQNWFFTTGMFFCQLSVIDLFPYNLTAEWCITTQATLSLHFTTHILFDNKSPKHLFNLLVSWMKPWLSSPLDIPQTSYITSFKSYMTII